MQEASDLCLVGFSRKFCLVTINQQSISRLPRRAFFFLPAGFTDPDSFRAELDLVRSTLYKNNNDENSNSRAHASSAEPDGTLSRPTHLPKMDCPRKAAGGHGMSWDLVARFDFAKSHRPSTRSSRWEDRSAIILREIYTCTSEKRIDNAVCSVL